jgi:hypothetical protein
MIEALGGIFCFVTAVVSFLYGTRVAWVCGKKCQFKEDPQNRKELLLECLPASTAIYFFGFMVVFGFLLDGFLTIFILSLTSAIILSHLVVTMAMPDLKRKPTPR